MHINKTIDCFFDKSGFSTNKIIGCNVQIVNITPNIKLNIDNEILEDINSNKIYSVSGILSNNINGQDTPLSNIYIYFLKDIISDFNDFSQREHMEIMKIYPIYDYCITNENGEYNVFLEPGIYNIKIQNGIYSEFIYNQEILDGLNHQRYLVPQNFTISNKHDDIIEINNSHYKIISGIMYDQYNKPLSDAEIIISKNNEVYAYIKTGKDGKYSFLLLNDIYDVRIRHRKYPIKIIKNFNFGNGNGFMTELKKSYNWFRKNDWIYIK